MWYVSDEWESLLLDCAEWKSLALEQVNDPGADPIPAKLSKLAERIAKFCDTQAKIDPSPLSRVWHLAEASQPPVVKVVGERRIVQKDPTLFGPKPTQAEFNAAMWRAIDVLDRLYAMGTTSIEPVEVPLTSTTPQAKGVLQWDAATEARNKWIYEKCMAVATYKSIIADLKRLAAEHGWEIIGTAPGISSAAEAYAQRHNLAMPPRRQGGRRVKQ